MSLTDIAASEEAPSWDEPQRLMAKYTAFLAITEFSIGAFLHFLSFPFVGTILSLNQIFLLARCAVTIPSPVVNRAPFVISTIAALMKVLAPVGKKMTPMLAICMQGLLFNIGILLFGKRTLGLITGSILASLWGIVQPLIIYSLFLGFPIQNSLTSLFSFWYSPQTPFFKILSIFIIVKIALAMIAVLLALKISENTFSRYTDFLKVLPKRSADKRPIPSRIFWSAVIETLFIFSLALTGFFFFSSQYSLKFVESYLLKPLAFYFAWAILNQILPTHRWIKSLAKKFPSIQQAYQDIKSWKK